MSPPHHRCFGKFSPPHHVHFDVSISGRKYETSPFWMRRIRAILITVPGVENLLRAPSVTLKRVACPACYVTVGLYRPTWNYARHWIGSVGGGQGGRGPVGVGMRGVGGLLTKNGRELGSDGRGWGRVEQKIWILGGGTRKKYGKKDGGVGKKNWAGVRGLNPGGRGSRHPRPPPPYPPPTHPPTPPPTHPPHPSSNPSHPYLPTPPPGSSQLLQGTASNGFWIDEGGAHSPAVTLFFSNLLKIITSCDG